MRKKYIVWDFDGTLANTNDIIIESWQATFRHYLGRELPVRDIEATFGETLQHTMSYLLPDVKYEEGRDYYRAYQDAHCDGKVHLFEGIREVLDELRERGCIMGIATSRTINSLKRYMEELGIDGYFEELVTMEDVIRHKPDPESVELALEKLGAEPDEAIMVGDTKFDIGCSNAAGVESVLIGWSHYVDEADIEAPGYVPTYRIAAPPELLKLI